jgi:predicted RNA-binding Zn-ribbon protein involved in translation (DUF1610 family)
VKNFNFHIEHKCPRCGAPAILEETDRLFTCPFCRVRSFLLEYDYFRYILPCPDNSKGPPICFPYWRFKGFLYSCGPAGTEHKFIDLSRQALESEYFPASLGLRSQALKLRFALPETKGTFIRPVILPADIIHSTKKLFSSQREGNTQIQSFIGETTSIIYAPFHVINNKLYDSILGIPVFSQLPGDFDISDYTAENPDWPIDFIPALCPACGWDLAGERDSLALLCRNCDSAWHHRNKRLEKIGMGYIPGGNDNHLFLPFWMIRAGISGIDPGAYADLVKSAGLPAAVQEFRNEVKFIFWIPALKIRAHHFLRIAKQMTFVQPLDEITEKVPEGTMHSVTLPVTEAIESLKIVMSGFIESKKNLFPSLIDAVIIPESYYLVYVPFRTGPHDLINEKYHIALNNNVLSTAENL